MTKLIVSIDTTSILTVNQLIPQIKDHVDGVKFGMEYFYANGWSSVKMMERLGIPIFLDVKLHDIPNTVAKTIKGLANVLNISMLTVHTAGGKEMLMAARDAAQAFQIPPLLLGVTILTSLSDINQIGFHRSISDQVMLMAQLAVESGIQGIVCSPHEIHPIKQKFGNQLKLVVPGIRPQGENAHDQKRIMTPEEAANLGADYLVIGRPITESPNPQAAAKRIQEAILTVNARKDYIG